MGGIAITPRMTAYAASKHGVQALTESVYLECAEAFPDRGVGVQSGGATRIFEDAPVHEQTAADAGFWRDQIREGMTADEAAKLLFDGIARGDFWILTHPESFERLASKRARCSARSYVPTRCSTAGTEGCGAGQEGVTGSSSAVMRLSCR